MKKIITSTLILFVTAALWAQPGGSGGGSPVGGSPPGSGGGGGGGGSTSGPIDGGTVFLLIGVACYGYYQIKQRETALSGQQ